MSEEKSSFTVKDRRIFAEKDEDVKNKEAKNEPSKQEAKDEDIEEAKTEPKVHLPEINFATFIISLNASALLHLGAMEDPATGKKVKKSSHGKTDNRYFRYDGRKNKRESIKRRREFAEKYSL
jgi:hypothetical protein